MDRTIRAWVRVGSWLVLSCMCVVPRASSQQRDEWPPAIDRAPPRAPLLLSKARSEIAGQPPRDPNIQASQAVIFQDSQLQLLDEDRLAVPLPDDSIATLIRERTEERQGGRLWVGHIDNDPDSRVYISVLRDRLTLKLASLHSGTHLFAGVAGTSGWLNRLNWRRLPCGLRAGHPPAIPTHVVTPPPVNCGTEPPSPIDLLVVYTQATCLLGADGAPDPVAMENHIQLFVDEANDTYLQSDIDLQLRLVGTKMVTYTASGDLLKDRDHLLDTTDGVLDEVPVRRNAVGADVVCMIVESSSDGYDGQSTQMDTLSPSFESKAYSVCVFGAFQSTYCMPHELGHLMGAAHECDVTGGTGVADDSHGFSSEDPAAEGGGWCTIMSEATLTWPRIGRWSNPGLALDSGVHTGVVGPPCTTDNHRVLNASALTVANFRCSQPVADDVWMRDTWDDTGLEPDPATAGQPMWRSPYIWVRRHQDTTGAHAHEHEDPEFGHDNWVYVKIHNSTGATASGQLDVYWAPASTAALWPAGWLPLGSESIASFDPHTTRIAEIRWPSLPGSGHFCLAAHWNSSGDPTPILATPDMSTNVRRSNNLIWKNVAIVDMVQALSVRAYDFSIRQPIGPDPESSRIRIRVPKGSDSQSFLRLGRIVVEMNPALLDAWSEGGREGHGFLHLPDGFHLVDASVVSFDNILVPPDARMTIHFDRLPGTPGGQYEIGVEQVNEGLVIGGLDFEIHCPER
jgi:hypothetical protein